MSALTGWPSIPILRNTVTSRAASVPERPTAQETRRLRRQVEEAARLFSILSESSRLRLSRALIEESLTVSKLIGATEMKQGSVSKHLGVLPNAGLVARHREGNFARTPSPTKGSINPAS